MSQSNTKVLLIEDSKFLCIANERALVKAGYLVRTAADGEKALQIANDQLPDIILLDMILPKLSGPEVLKALKTNPATTAIPVIVLTSLSQKNEEKLLKEGAAAYFEKSALDLDKNSDRLASAINEVLSRVNHEKDLNLRLQQAAQKRAATLNLSAGHSPEDRSEDDWEIEIAGIESSSCTTTTPPSRSKN